MIDRRFRIVGGKYLVRAAVAVFAIGGGLAGLGRLGVLTMFVSCLFVGVAIDASRRPTQVLVLRIVGGFMTVDTGEKRAVNRVLEFGVIEIQADRLTIDLLGHGGIAVTGKAVLIGAFLLGISRKSANQQKECERLEKAFCGAAHSYEQTLQ